MAEEQEIEKNFNNNHVLRCKKNFVDLVRRIKIKWHEKFGFTPSDAEVTGLIAKRIEKAGGFVV